jgi:rubredoxin
VAKSRIVSEIQEKLDPTKPREVVDYALQRKAALAEVARGRLFREEICDADPNLKRTSRWHGIVSSRFCPVCEIEKLREISYVFSKELGPFSGRIKKPQEISEMSLNFGQIRVFVVEICELCGWNHLHSSYVVGDGNPRKPLRKPPDWLD